MSNHFSINPPQNTDLAFFTYGIFKPGQLGYKRIEKYVESYTKAEIPHRLLVMNGIALLDSDITDEYKTSGYLLFFKDKSVYDLIGSVEPDALYDWATLEVENTKCNVLFSKKHIKSQASLIKSGSYNWRDDYLFTKALKLIENDLNSDDFFEVKRNYLLLFSSIERYSCLKYGHFKIMDNLRLLAGEDIFKESLKRNVSESRVFLRSDNFKEVFLNPLDSVSSIEYYSALKYLVLFEGEDKNKKTLILKKSLKELLNVFQDVIENT